MVSGASAGVTNIGRPVSGEMPAQIVLSGILSPIAGMVDEVLVMVFSIVEVAKLK
jgi:hypothetical protein